MLDGEVVEIGIVDDSEEEGLDKDGADGGDLKRWRGIIGIMANLHSTRINMTIQMPPNVIMEITIGLL